MPSARALLDMSKAVYLRVKSALSMGRAILGRRTRDRQPARPDRRGRHRRGAARDPRRLHVGAGPFVPDARSPGRTGRGTPRRDAVPAPDPGPRHGSGGGPRRAPRGIARDDATHRATPPRRRSGATCRSSRATRISATSSRSRSRTASSRPARRRRGASSRRRAGSTELPRPTPNARSASRRRCSCCGSRRGQGAVDVDGVEVTSRGTATRDFIDCARRVLGGHAIPVPGAVPGTRHRLTYPLQ